MSKVVILNFPSHGCINPILATISELVNRGEDVIFYCTEEFRSKIIQTGAKFKAYKGLKTEFKIKNNSLFSTLRLNIKMALKILECNFSDIQKESPDYIIHDSMSVWGKIIASKTKVPVINLMHSYPISKTSIPFNLITFSFILKLYLYKLIIALSKNDPANQLKNRYGVTISLSDILINKERLNIVYTSKYMQMKLYRNEDSYYFVGPSLFFKNVKTDLPISKVNSRKIVYISLGTLHNYNYKFYKVCLKSFENKDFDVIISVGNKTDFNQLGNISPNIYLQRSVNQQQLLKHVDLFITHAGMNSVNEAICNGVPMLTLPHHFEQKLIAQKVRLFGVGKVLNIKRISSSNLIKNVNDIFYNKKYKRRALQFKSIFSEEEKTGHIKASDRILEFVKYNL